MAILVFSSNYPLILVAAYLLYLLYYTIAGAIHRLYFSPISHIPGPKLAALTFWYTAEPVTIWFKELWLTL